MATTRKKTPRKRKAKARRKPEVIVKEPNNPFTNENEPEWVQAATKKTLGRPAGYNFKPETGEDICKIISATGCFLETAAAYCETTVHTLRIWIAVARNVRDLRNEKGDPKAYPLWATNRKLKKEADDLHIFFTQLEKAVSSVEVKGLLTLAKASRDVKGKKTRTSSDGTVTESEVLLSKGDWRAEAWRLERRFKKKYGQKIEAEIETGKSLTELIMASIEEGKKKEKSSPEDEYLD